mgnify:CR=1 FL=1
MTNRERAVEISVKMGLSHIGSVLTALPIIEEIYEKKKLEEKFVLSSGHAHLAHAVALEGVGIGDAEEMVGRFGIHCDKQAGCDVSTGSLGQGIAIACGLALADRGRNVYCLVSYGEMAEGSCWEALRIAKEQKLDNLKVYLNANGMGAMGMIDVDDLEKRIKAFGFPVEIRRTDPGLGNWAVGLQAHYKVADEELLKGRLVIG